MLISNIVLGMALLRVLSGSIELLAALLIYRFNSIEKALIINSSLAFVGPLIFITVTALGLVGVADKLSFGRLLWIAAGILCLIVGILKK